MAQFFTLHPDNPQERLVRQAADIIRAGGVVVLPTDSCYALVCALGDKKAMERIIAIRQLDLRHHFTLLCHNLSELGLYAKVDNSQFRVYFARHQRSAIAHAASQAQNHRFACARPCDCASGVE